MSTAAKTDSVRFTTKGQVVIPAWLRKQFHIENGTKAVVQTTPEPMTLALVIKSAARMVDREPPDVEGATRFASALFLGGIERLGRGR